MGFGSKVDSFACANTTSKVADLAECTNLGEEGLALCLIEVLRSQNVKWGTKVRALQITDFMWPRFYEQ